ncbi:MAG TPA: hypothetical protein VNE39_16260 [Planctomycetota bacterium]|nr:hypothetical protein [Planctomycetota bacterium]
MPSATFHNVPIGDAANGVLALHAGNIERSVLVDQPLGLDGAVTRHRGGGRQTILVQAWKQCASAAERLGYIEGLMAAFGSEHATLTCRDGDAAKSWTRCLAAAVREDKADGPYVEFTVTFLRSAF